MAANYRQPLLGTPDPQLRKSMALSTTLGVLVLAIVILAPTRVEETPTVEDVPERLAKLILEPKKPAPVLPPAPVKIDTPPLPEVVPEAPPEPVAEAVPEKAPERVKEPSKPKARTQRKEKLDADRGVAGRTKAQTEVAAALTQTTESVKSTLNSLSEDLASVGVSSGDTAPKRKGGRRRPGRGRSGAEAGGAVAARTGVGSEHATGTVVTGDFIDIESIGGGPGTGDLASADPALAGGGPESGSYRSNASLLAVVRKYAAGIQFCYDNQLKQEPGLKGKMVVVLTVQASGQVSEAKIAEDGLGSGALRQCVLAQVRAWKFPAIPEGVVTFRTPFVFTPPQ